MIRAKFDNVLFIGLEERNIELLKEDKPLNFKADDVGFPGLEIVIITGKDNIDILNKLRQATVSFPDDHL